MTALVVVLVLMLAAAGAAAVYFYLEKKKAEQRREGAGISAILRSVLGGLATTYTGGLAAGALS